MLRPWTVTGSAITYEDRWLKVRSDRCVTATGRAVEPFHVLEYPDWAFAVAVTPAWRVVLVREYRHGAGEVLLGLPCGAVDARDDGPEAAMRRELREETGYVAGRAFALGSMHANPANQPNRAHPYLAFDARREHAQCLDPAEEIEVLEDDLVDFLRRLWHGEVSVQAIHAAALHAASHRILRGTVDAPPGLREALRAELLRP